MAEQQKTEKRRYRPVFESYQEGRFTREEIRAAIQRVREKAQRGELPPPEVMDMRGLGSEFFRKYRSGADPYQ